MPTQTQSRLHTSKTVYIPTKKPRSVNSWIITCSIGIIGGYLLGNLAPMNMVVLNDDQKAIIERLNYTCGGIEFKVARWGQPQKKHKDDKWDGKCDHVIKVMYTIKTGWAYMPNIPTEELFYLKDGKVKHSKALGIFGIGNEDGKLYEDD